MGWLKRTDENLTKNEDLIEIISVVGHDLSKNWSITGYVSFKTQFAYGYDADFDTVKISEFMAPGYLTVSPSIRYQPNENFYILMSPATAKFTFVMDQELADLGSFGVTPAEKDTSGNIIKEGETMLVYMGPFVEAYFKKEVAKNLLYESRLNLLYTFLNRDNLEVYDMDASWENFLNYSIAKYFSISLFLHFVYLPGQPSLNSKLSTGLCS